MGKRTGHAKTFAEIVAALPELPAVPAGRAHAVRPGGINLAGEWFSPEGHRLSIGDEEIAPDVATDMVRAGAAVVWDSCGCGASCGGPTWLAPAQLASLRESKPPRMRDGWLLRADANGKPIVVVVRDIHWGSQFE